MLFNTSFFSFSIYGNDRQRRFFSFLYIKSKTAFKTSFQPLSKLAERVKIHLQLKFKGFVLWNKFIFLHFWKTTASHCGLTWHISDMHQYEKSNYWNQLNNPRIQREIRHQASFLGWFCLEQEILMLSHWATIKLPSQSYRSSCICIYSMYKNLP